MEKPLKNPQKPDKKERAAQREIVDIFFNDVYLRRGRVYRVNFFRGIFFGLGTIIGGTLVIAILIFLLSFLVDIPGGLGDFIHWIVKTIQNR